MKEKIYFNIWDDYSDDDTGESQETWSYIESDLVDLGLADDQEKAESIIRKRVAY